MPVLFSSVVISPWAMYWLVSCDRIRRSLDSLSVTGVTIVIFALFASIVIGIAVAQLRANDNSYATESYKTKPGTYSAFEKIAKIVRRILVWTIPFWLTVELLLMATPTTKELAAVYVVPALVNNERVQDMGAEIIEIAGEWMRELHPRKPTEKKEKQ